MSSLSAHKEQRTADYTLKIEVDPAHTKTLLNYQDQLIEMLRKYNQDLKSQVKQLNCKLIQYQSEQTGLRRPFQQQNKYRKAQTATEAEVKSLKQIISKVQKQKAILENENRQIKKEINKYKKMEQKMNRQNLKIKEANIYQFNHNGDHKSISRPKLYTIKHNLQQISQIISYELHYPLKQKLIPKMAAILKSVQQIQYENRINKEVRVEPSEVLYNFKTSQLQKEINILELKDNYKDQSARISQQSQKIEPLEVNSIYQEGPLNFGRMYRRVQKALQQVESTEEQIKNISLRFDLHMI